MLRLTLLILLFWAILAAAAGETGSDRIGSGQCPDNVETVMVYSPFKPYWKFSKFGHDRQKCWVASDCLFEAAGESRKQQFAATALVMGLIPLTLKDVAWPERRIVHVTKPLPWICDILVLALGLVPLPADRGAPLSTRQNSEASNGLAKYAWKMRRLTIRLVVAALTVCLMTCYAALVFNEIYSKRSALGCVVPFFITAWYIVALVPASIHKIFAGRRKTRFERLEQEPDTSVTEQLRANPFVGPQSQDSLPEIANKALAIRRCEGGCRGTAVSAVQGADEDWPVQMAWGIYYIAGTLIFTSIMATYDHYTSIEFLDSVMSNTQSPFYVPVDLSATALIISDVQTQILGRFPKHIQAEYLSTLLRLVNFFRIQIAHHRANILTNNSNSNANVPLIVHHTLPFNINRNAFVSPYNKLAKWVKSLENAGYFERCSSDPHHPDYAIPSELVPSDGWGGSQDEIVLGKLQPNCFGSSDLLKYLGARGIRHVVLVGLTTMGSVLGIATRAGADLDFHIICPREAIMDDDAEVDEFLMSKVLPKFVDVVELADILSLEA
ncbi:uncharacterized protein yc1106_09509 [Curvularia clavata]|uniref:Isochorismatase-like domain-containing protein n=1 Tax=Curvularia clavata TaxID=95742 RepID=A0A9Q8ZIB4_CURCL|nr:uncharacterized protein yc1106_09509 [Curvularia clavata]